MKIHEDCSLNDYLKTMIPTYLWVFLKDNGAKWGALYPIWAWVNVSKGHKKKHHATHNATQYLNCCEGSRCEAHASINNNTV